MIVRTAPMVMIVKVGRIIVTENVIVALSHNILAIDSPAPAHDELDTAE